MSEFKNIPQPGARVPIKDEEGALLVSLAEKSLTLMSIWSAMREAGYYRDRDTYKEYLFRYDPKYEYLTRKDFSDEEDQIIRDGAAAGLNRRGIVDLLRQNGHIRKIDTVRSYMRVNNIKSVDIDPEIIAANRFAAAFEAGADGRLYRDDPAEAWKSRTTRPREVRDYGCNHMTTGGVAVYG